MGRAVTKTIEARNLPPSLTRGMKPDQLVRVTVEPVDEAVQHALDAAEDLSAAATSAGLTDEAIASLIDEARHSGR